MEVANIEISKLYVSNINVRKTLISEEDETGITDLANDININGRVYFVSDNYIENKFLAYEHKQLYKFHFNILILL